MKRLLYLAIGFTLLTPLAYADQSYNLAKVSCESGVEAKISLFEPDSMTTNLKLSLDSMTLTLASQSFEIVPLGLPDPGSKYIQVYRAFPNSESSVSTTIFVEVSEDENLVLVRRLDDDLTACGGGFINFEFTSNR